MKNKWRKITVKDYENIRKNGIRFISGAKFFITKRENEKK